nr:hypothetical protein [Tanacetum cinerariifolium]
MVTRLTSVREVTGSILAGIYKQLYDTIKPTRIRSKEQCNALIKQVNQKYVEIYDLNVSLQEKDLVITALKDELRKLKGKALVDNVVTPYTIALEILKIDVEPIALRLLNNKTTHSKYLRLTQEQATILREVVEQGKSQNPLHNSLDHAYAYKTYYDFATRKVIPKPKYVRRSTGEKTDQAPKASPAKRLKATADVAKSGKKKLPAQGLETLSEIAFDEGKDDEVSMSKDDEDNAYNEDDDDPDDDNEQTESDNDGDNVEEEKLDEEKTYEEEESSFVSSGFISKMLNPNLDKSIDSILNLNIESTTLVDVPVTTNDEIPLSSVTTLPPPPIPLIQPMQQTPVSIPKIAPSTSLQNLPTFGSLFKFEDRVKSLEDDFSEFKQTNLFAKTVSLIYGIFDKYLANQMNEVVKAKIIKEQVKVQVKKQVSKILPRIKKSVNEQLEAEVLIRSSNKAKTSHVVAANLSELKLKKILIDKIENNKSIDRSVQKKTKDKALVDAYETDKDILATYGDTVTLKRCRDDEDEDDKPSAGSNRGSKRRKARKEPESTKEQVYTVKDLEELAHQEFKIGFTEDHPVNETSQLLDWFQKPAKPPTLNLDWKKTLPTNHGPIQPWISTLARNEDRRGWSFNEMMDTPLEFSAFVLNRLKVNTLTLKLLASPTFELMKVNRKSTRDVYSRHRIIAITKLTIVEWYNYKHLDWITVHRDDDKLYTFKEGDYKRLRLQDIEDMLFLLVQGKLKNHTIDERLAWSVSLRMFTRSMSSKGV